MICGSLSEQVSSKDQPSCSTWDENSVSNVFILHTYESGSPRRCGGQGDILAGCVGSAVHWTTSLHSTTRKSNTLIPLQRFDSESSGISKIEEILVREISPLIQGCILASIVTKKASYLAYQKKGRSTTSPDIMEEIGRALEIVIDEV